MATRRSLTADLIESLAPGGLNTLAPITSEDIPLPKNKMSKGRLQRLRNTKLKTRAKLAVAKV